MRKSLTFLVISNLLTGCIYADGCLFTPQMVNCVDKGKELPWQIGSLSFGIGNTDTTGSNDVGIPLWGMIMGDHTRAYYRDEDVIRFLNKNEDVNSILNYQKKIWQGEKVKTKIISFSNENSANIKGEK